MKTSKITNKRINKGNVVLDREAHFDDFEACFEDIDEALKGVRKDNKMCQWVIKPISPLKACTKSSIFIIVQLEKSAKNRNISDVKFTHRDSMLLRVLCGFLSQRILVMITEYKFEESIRRSIGILEWFNADVSQYKNLASIYKNFKSHMPNIFKTSNWGMFFVDHDNPSILYTAEKIEEDRDGIDMITQIIKYPIGLGLTGMSVKLNKTMAYYKNDGFDVNEENKEFASEIDNYVSESNLKNGLFCPMVDHKGTIQGAVQLLNKLNGESKFETYEILQFEYVCKILGRIIFDAHQSIDVMSLSAKMFPCIKSMLSLFNNDLSPLHHSMESGVESGIKSITDLLNEMIEEKRWIMFRDKVLMRDTFKEIYSQHKDKTK